MPHPEGRTQGGGPSTAARTRLHVRLHRDAPERAHVGAAPRNGKHGFVFCTGEGGLDGGAGWCAPSRRPRGRRAGRRAVQMQERCAGAVRKPGGSKCTAAATPPRAVHRPTGLASTPHLLWSPAQSRLNPAASRAGTHPPLPQVCQRGAAPSRLQGGGGRGGRATVVVGSFEAAERGRQQGRRGGSGSRWAHRPLLRDACYLPVWWSWRRGRGSRRAGRGPCRGQGQAGRQAGRGQE